MPVIYNWHLDLRFSPRFKLRVIFGLKDLLRYTWVNRVAFLAVTTKSCKMASCSMQLCSFMFLKAF